ncbi:Homoserine O-acetyltransferase [Planktothrix tepida]|uniref:Homoserine O-acetyltransferase n=1 Tax=Planktothrix tepida PCC 9214 TaxID=671072 RepID=A0A1J1LII6_9CYAN|nr:homoserine O-acetyltransferase [Planktothrix tepida]CAD5983300.1 Homoserine O-acetyltransferase [Planktothrix tepida]CUR32307.1 Homoserine O-acetyltransferase [Planktothrix tepida PCC 9214]
MDYQQFISPLTQFYQLPQPFQLESGAVLENVQIAYRTWGTLNPAGDNGVLVCHAFTGWADLENWWSPLLGTGQALNPDQDFIVCSNILGSCYGTTGPTSINPQTGQPYGPTFPNITIRDMVHLQAQLVAALGIRSLRLVIGGSLGGMQVLEWALLYPSKLRAIAVIAASGRHSAWCIGLSEAQRQAIYVDPNWQGGYYSPEKPPHQGLKVARMIAMTTYRSWPSFSERFGRQTQAEAKFAIANYLNHQGDKLVERFDANTYITLTRSMDSHDVSRPEKTYEAVLQSISHPTLIIAIDSDVLYPVVEQEELAALIPQAKLVFLDSHHGHDAFLMDMDALNRLLLRFQADI